MLESYDGYKNLFVTPVWGEEFVQEFLEISLPTQLSDLNLGSLDPEHSIYCIATSKSDRRIIESSEILCALRERVSVQFLEYEDAEIFERNSYVLMHDMYNRALALVKAEINCFFLSADIFCSDGLFTHALAAMDAGKKVVFVPTVRVAKETFVRNVRERGISSPSASEAVGLILQHEHVITKAGIVNDVSGAIFPLSNHTVYRMKNGYVGRWNVMHPLVVRLLPAPPKVEMTVDWNYGVANVLRPEEIEIFWDSDMGIALTTAPKSYTQGVRLSYGGTNEMRTKNLIRWLGYGWALKVHVMQMDKVVCLHTGPVDEVEYAKGLFAVDQIWKPFRDVLEQYKAPDRSDYSEHLSNLAVSKARARWIRLQMNPTGVIRSVFRRVARIWR